jgi:TPR repeat protein
MDLKKEIKAAKEAGEYETVVENFLILADMGDTFGEREYAKLLEKGSLVPRDIDLATDYFYRAAKKNDATSAYRYSRLVSRMNDAAGRFWLSFSAVLGCQLAYLGTADNYAELGKHEYANYYYYLAASGDDVDAIVKLASRYYNGEGIEWNESYAKWYMDKLTFPPLHAIKMAYKLRSVKADEAPAIACKNYDTMIRELIGEAKRSGFPTAEAYLNGLLSERGDTDAMCELAEHLLFDENGKNPNEAIRVLTRAAAGGSARAYTMLGLVYRSGALVPQNLSLALDSFEHAGKLGDAEAYELMGDIYHSKSYTGRDIAKACECYELAAKGGVATAEEKAASIRASREGYYYHATRDEDTDPERAFRGYAISAMMGCTPAMLKLAECYALGIGTKKDRSLAFEYYQKSVNAGLEEAYFPLGICYSRGVGVAFDFDMAVKNLTRALKNGDERAKKELFRLYENKKRHLGNKLYSQAMRLIYQKKFSEAVKVLTVAIEFKHPKAIYTLGCLYEFGRGVECDKRYAYDLYTAAEKLSFKDTRSKYKSNILRMIKK